MQRKTKTILITVFILIILIAVAAIIIRLKLNSAETSKKPSLVVNVVLGKAVRGDVAKVESLTGNVLSDQQASIYTRVSGNIEKIFADIGQFVKEGQLLALIDTTIYSQNAKQAAASYEQTLANLANAKLNNDRNQSLFEQNLISKQDADNTKTAYEIALAQKNGSYANYINAITQLSYCRITATFTGYVTKRFFDAGTYVTSSANASSSVLFTLTDLNNLKAKVFIPEKDVAILDRIIEINIIADAIPNQIFNAKLKKISGSVDLATRTMETEIDITNLNNLLKPGMFITVNFILEKKSNVLILPNDVVLNDNKGDYVYIVNQNNTVSRRDVKIGIKQDNKDEIISGIQDDESIVFSGQNLLKDGSTIKIAK